MTGHDQEPSVRITLREVWEVVLRIERGLSVLASVPDQLADHEARLRTQSRQLQVVAAVGVIVGIVVGRLSDLAGL